MRRREMCHGSFGSHTRRGREGRGGRGDGGREREVDHTNATALSDTMDGSRESMSAPHMDRRIRDAQCRESFRSVHLCAS
jgi:hypothetical protein